MVSKKDDQILNHIDEAIEFAKETGVINTDEESKDYLNAVKAQILRLFWTQSKKLLVSDLGTEMQHLVLQDTVQMAKILKDWSLGDKTLGLKDKKDFKEFSVAEHIDMIVSSAEKRHVPVEINLKGLKEMDKMNQEDFGESKMVDLGVLPIPEKKKVDGCSEEEKE